jgi:outer membrane biosynthesis protein TonB
MNRSHCLLLVVAALISPAVGAAEQPDKQALTAEEQTIIDKIRQEFRRNSDLITALYRRALRDDSSLTGYVRVEIRISPTGDVLECVIESSDFKSDLMNDLLPEIVSDMKFKGLGNKDVLVVTYPIEFLPN